MGTEDAAAYYYVVHGMSEGRVPPLPFQSFLLQTGTAVPAAASSVSWDYAVADFDRDGVVALIGVEMNGTGTGTTGAHVLDGAATPAAASPGSRDYVAADYDRDGVSDLIGVEMNGTGTTKVHVFYGG